MNDDFPFPRWLCRILSHLAAFTIGVYAYSTFNGQPVEDYRWALTGLFGLMFFVGSLKFEKK